VVRCARALETTARGSERQVRFARRPERKSRQNAVLVAPVLVSALLLSAVATVWHDCRGHDHAECAICWLAKAPICTSEDTTPAPPETWLELIVQPTARPVSQPLLTFAARAPPAELL